MNTALALATGPITHTSAWQPHDLGGKDALSTPFTAAQIDALREATQRARAAGLAPQAVTQSDFAHPELSEAIESWRQQIFNGRGFVLLRGLPVETMTIEEIETLYFGLGTYFGSPVSQSKLGDLIGHVTNIGGDDRRERAYRNSRELTMHTDRCDVVAMLCVRKAVQGGLSGYTSAHTIYNVIRAERPDLLEPLLRGFQYHRFGEQPEGQPQVTSDRVPILSDAQGKVSVIFLRTYIEMAATELGVPLTEHEIEALDFFEQVAARDELRLRFMLEPGDLVFFNNCTMLHHRTAFEDGTDPATNRLLLRLWLLAPNDWPRTQAHARYKGLGIAQHADRSTYYDGGALAAPVRRPATG
jgi:hypothetical protein